MKQDNLQPNSGIPNSTEEVQRLTSEQESNNLDTSTPHLLILKCSQCKELKTTQDFYPSKRYKRGYDYRCIDCCIKRTTERHYKLKPKILQQWKTRRDSYTIVKKRELAEKNKEWYQKNIRSRLLSAARHRSNRLGFECNLDLDDIQLPKKCPLLNIEFEFGTRYDKWKTYSIDRIDNSKGYIKGNIQIISYLANTMKSKASKEELITFSKNILIMFKDDDIV